MPALSKKSTRKMKSKQSPEEMLTLIEALEERIAPAGLDTGVNWKAFSFDTPILLKAGEGISTGALGTGAYLMHVSQGQALVFATDLNDNGTFDYNEITGISAGDGLRLTSFVDINGDIVTNLNPDGTLTDFQPSVPGNDGRVLLNSKIEGVTIRSITAAETSSFNEHLAFTTYSIYGNIIAGNGFGVSGAGLVIDTAGFQSVKTKFNGDVGSIYYAGAELNPNVGYIMTGTAASGLSFSFGVKEGWSSAVSGKIAKFTPAAGAIGGDVFGVKVGNNASTNAVDPETGESLYDSVAFQIGGIQTGDGGSGARGGNISGVTLEGDIGGFFAIAGKGGSGSVGGSGGSIINLVDLGSQNGLVQIKSGDGGVGFNGKGGNGGTISLGQFSTTGVVSILMGSGGDGTLGGGNGAGLGSGSFTPIDVTDVPIPLKIASTYRLAGEIGSQHQVDFNNDGIGDIAYIAKDPNILVVRLGVNTGSGVAITDFSPTYYLPAPAYDLESNTAALVIGDFDGDGKFDDIATASNMAYSSDGLYVYTFDEASESFGLPIRSTVPFWNLGSSGPVDFYGGGGAITDLVAGDFDADGKTDIAFTGQYKSASLIAPLQTALVVMSNAGSGYFSVNINRDSGGWTEAPVFGGIGKGHNEVVVQSTAITKGDVLSDIIVVSSETAKSLATYQITTNDYPDGGLEELANESGKYRVRSYDDKTGTVKFGATAVTALPTDFTILDIDNDGVFDLVSLNQEGVVIAFGGAADGTFSQPDTNGIFLTGDFGVLGGGSTKLNDSFKGIVAGDFDGDLKVGEFGVYSVAAGDDGGVNFYVFSITGLTQYYDVGSKEPAGDTFALGDPVAFVKPNDVDNEVIAFSIYQGDILVDKAFGFVIGAPNSVSTADEFIQVNGLEGMTTLDSAWLADISNTSFALAAGHGGNSQLGAGGAGGSIGNGSLSQNADGVVTASIDIAIPMGDPGGGFSQNFLYTAGNGGNGFTAGGAGGSVSGIKARYVDGTGSVLASSVTLVGGSGGDAVQGKGGKGGEISKISAETMSTATAGNGGDGLIGGDGGSILGNGISSLFDATTVTFTLRSGSGGEGVSAGGHGGNISGVKASFLALIGGVGGAIDYRAGDGGDAVSGRAGNGGSLINMSPDTATTNFLVGNIFLTAGNGGNGLGGGNGGSITTFVNRPGSGSVPLAISFMAGQGGTGISLSGGNGGSLSGITVSGTGEDAFGDLLFGRFLAGQGGESYGGVGGNGGGLSGLNVSTQNTSLAIAAGAGGLGLTAGGAGGSVLSSVGTAAGGASKLLVIAGDGGNAYGFTSASVTSSPTLQNQLWVIGNVNSVGGNGGAINGFKATGEQVFTDLIAGNGGSLMNYGSLLAKPATGKGGSVTNITLEGSAGDYRVDQAIQSYTPLGTAMSEFVTGWLAADGGGTLSNAQGNVGVLVGAAGRVNVNEFPETQGMGAPGTNGSVATFSAKNIMSMVAGSVDRISAILSITNLTVPPSGALGSYKTNPVPHGNTPYYFDAGGNPSDVASPGGKLMDGAILAITKPASLVGARIF